MMDFDGLVDRYEKPIYNLIYRLTGDREEAADITQETFVAAYRSFTSFRGESTVYTWLYRIAINKCRNAFKKSGKPAGFEFYTLKDEDREGAEISSDRAVSSEDGPEDVVQRKELRERIERAVDQLPQDYRIVFVLRDMQGLSYQEIAEAADLSIDVVRTRLARARAMLRQKLEPYFME